MSTAGFSRSKFLLRLIYLYKYIHICVQCTCQLFWCHLVFVQPVSGRHTASPGFCPLPPLVDVAAQEIDKLRTLDHPAVLRLFEYCADERNLYLITDLLPGRLGSEEFAAVERFVRWGS